MATEDHELIRRAIGGDADALSDLLRRHGPVVERMLVIGPAWQSAIDPADVMQVTYLEAFMQIDRLAADEAGGLITWLRRIAENNVRDAIRGLERDKRPSPRKRVGPTGIDDSLTGLYALLGATSTTPSRELGRRELVERMREAISALPRSYAEVIRLYDLESLPIGEVAQSLNRSTGAVHMLRTRAHEHLRRQLEAMSTRP